MDGKILPLTASLQLMSFFRSPDVVAAMEKGDWLVEWIFCQTSYIVTVFKAVWNKYRDAEELPFDL